jgi:hypothetical protein
MPLTISPYKKRLEVSDSRLRDALERLIQGRPVHPHHQKGYRFTVAVLAREAGICRNAIYANHRAFIDALATAAATDRRKPPESLQDKIDELRAIISTMKQEERRMISENAALLQRARAAEADAERCRQHHARLVTEQNTELHPVPITVPTQRTAPSNQNRKGSGNIKSDRMQDS